MIDIAVLVSVGRHPASGRPRRAAADARAVELALGLAGAQVRLVHAGDPEETALRDYLGMGAGRLTVLRCAPEEDVLPSLIRHLRDRPPQVLLSGVRAEAGEDSGTVPYLLAEALGLPLSPAVVALELAGEAARMLQALPRGRRRRLEAPLPLIATVPLSAPPPRLPAFALARRGRIEVLDGGAPRDEERLSWEERPARRRPKRLRVMGKGSAADRVRAVTEMQAGKGRLLKDVEPREAAEAIWSYLVEEGIVREKGRERG